MPPVKEFKVLCFLCVLIVVDEVAGHKVNDVLLVKKADHTTTPFHVGSLSVQSCVLGMLFLIMCA